MYKKSFVIVVALCLSLMLGTVGCARKKVRHLASDCGLVTPGITTKQEVVNYLGQPDSAYKLPEGNLLWVYYESKSTMWRDTPYIGEKIGEETYEIVKVTFNGDIVQSIVYRTMSEEDFKEIGPVE
ncbi:MAG: hypothetical protein OEL85_00480 [Desulfobulbaceae bacterium]|nr:hypothetical protein [Desulfobulbaceae bacterium]